MAPGFAGSVAGRAHRQTQPMRGGEAHLQWSIIVYRLRSMAHWPLHLTRLPSRVTAAGAPV